MGGDRVPGPLDDDVDLATRWKRAVDAKNLRDPKYKASIQEFIEYAREQQLQEFERLNRIAHAVYHGKRGGFLKKFAAAWMHADPFNKRIIRPAFCALIKKYNLDEDPTGLGGQNTRSDI